MSRIADVLQKARKENATPDGPQTHVDTPGLSLRSIADVKVPWSVKGTPPGQTEPEYPEPGAANRFAPRQPTTAPAPAAADKTMAPMAETVAAPETHEPTSVKAPAAGTAAQPRTVPTPRRGAGRASDAPTDEAVTLARELFLAANGRFDSSRAVHVCGRFAGLRRVSRFRSQKHSPSWQADRCTCLTWIWIIQVSTSDLISRDRIGFSDAVMEDGELRGYAHQASSASKLWVMPAGLQTADVRPVVGDASTHRRIARADQHARLRDRPYGRDRTVSRCRADRPPVRRSRAGAPGKHHDARGDTPGSQRTEGVGRPAARNRSGQSRTRRPLDAAHCPSRLLSDSTGSSGANSSPAGARSAALMAILAIAAVGTVRDEKDAAERRPVPCWTGRTGRMLPGPSEFVQRNDTVRGWPFASAECLGNDQRTRRISP